MLTGMLVCRLLDTVTTSWLDRKWIINCPQANRAKMAGSFSSPRRATSQDTTEIGTITTGTMPSMSCPPAMMCIAMPMSTVGTANHAALTTACGRMARSADALPLGDGVDRARMSRDPSARLTYAGSMFRNLGEASPRKPHARWLLGLGLMLMILMVGASPASAHTRLLSSDPADGSSLDVAPTRITLTANEDVLSIGTVLSLTEPDGTVINLPKPQVDGPLVIGQLPALTQHGTYRATYRIVSGDGHPVDGVIAFSLGTGQPPVTTGTSQSGQSSSWGIGIVAGLVVAIGVFVLIGVRRARARSIATGSMPSDAASGTSSTPVS